MKTSTLKLSLLILIASSVLINLNCKKTKKEIDLPSIDSLVPEYGTIGDVVVIHGKNLVDIDQVTFQGVMSKIVNVNATQLTTVVPNGVSAGMINVAVRNEGGASNQLSYELFAKPAHVDSLPPKLKNVYPSASYTEYPVLIYGDYLSGVLKVTFNDKPATIFTNNQNVVTTTVPKDLAPGKITIKVVTMKGESTFNFQTLGPPPTPSNVNFSIINIPPPNYLPSISNNWSCGLFAKRETTADGYVHFVDLNSDSNFDENYNITGRYKYNFDKQAGYNVSNYVEIINKAESDTLVGAFSSKFDRPCVYEMVLISSKTKGVFRCTFDTSEFGEPCSK